MIDPEIELVLTEINRFPCKISSSNGKKIKQFFDLVEQMESEKKDLKSLRFKYRKKIGEFEYSLLEEYLFKETETILDLKRAISVNYYLNRK